MLSVNQMVDAELALTPSALRMSVAQIPGKSANSQHQGNAKCGSWCGTGYLYCSAPACQIEYGPACDANVRPNGPDTINIARPKIGDIPYGEAISRCGRNGDIALTYDDGPFTYTEDLLDLLQVSDPPTDHPPLTFLGIQR